MLDRNGRRALPGNPAKQVYVRQRPSHYVHAQPGATIFTINLRLKFSVQSTMTTSANNGTPRISVEKFKQHLDEQHPFAAILGIEVLEIGSGSSLLRLPERDAHKRLGGTIAGPMLMGLADLALYAAIVGATGNTQAVTASLTINFLRRTPPGGVLAIHNSTGNQGKRPQVVKMRHFSYERGRHQRRE